MALFANTPRTTASKIPPPMDVPQTQNTAPVLEFRCLYTQDLRRKHKRWQDGRLKFHTFNKRVMIYDEQSNFVGDTHWHDDDEFAEGEELQLDRRGILVEVGECLGKKDQDLTELLSKRIQEKEERAVARSTNPSPTTPAGQFQNVRPAPAVTTLAPKPLSALLTPSRHYGRAVVPSTSPFEERQRLENGGHNEAANRPAKKRKPNDSTQTKSGYAQNLMGTTLNLVSSRPPSTATVRYDALKLNIHRPSEAAIDLTLDDDDGRDLIKPKPSDAGHATPAARQAAVKRASSRRASPPLKSSYAGNLTGTALVLTGLSATSARPPCKALATEKPPRIRNYDNGSSPAVENDGIFIDIDPSLNQPAMITGPRAPTTEPSKLVRPKNTSNVDNCLQSILPQPSTNTISSLPETTNGDVDESMSDQPMSSLRIKVRPPRKMMMLMDRPDYRPRKAPSRKVGAASKCITKPSQSTDEPTLSQDTRHLNSFYQNQEEKLEAFRKGKRRPINRDLEEDEEENSSPMDKRTDYGAINPPFSPKNCAESTTLHLSDGPPRPVRRGSGQSVAPIKPLPGQPNKAEGQVELNDSTDNLLMKGGCLSSGVESEDKPASNRKCVLDQPKNVEGDLSPADTSVISPKPKMDCMGRTDQPLIVDSRDTSAALVAGTKSASEPDQLDTQSDLTTKVSSTNQFSEEGNKNPPRQEHDHTSKTVRCTSERFRAMVQPSASSASPEFGARSVAIVSSVGIAGRPILDLSSSSQDLDLDSSGQVVEAPSELVDKQWSMPDTKSSSDSGFRSANMLNKTTSGPRHNPVLESSNMGPSQLKARLSNPATRGKSVQAAATITDGTATDALGQASTTWAPLIEHISSRPAPGSIFATSRNVVQNEGSVRSAPVAGPWSREAFDLFGSWLPPGRERSGEGMP